MRIPERSKSLLLLILAGLLAGISSSSAGTVTKSYTFSSGATASASQVNANFDQLFTEMNAKETRLTTVEAISAPTTAAFFLDEVTALNGSLTRALDAAQQYGHYYENTAGAADGDGFEIHVFLKAGTYTLYALGATWMSRGLIDWSIDGTVVAAGQDWYSAGLVYNVVKTVSITVPTSGDHVLKAVVNGKNGASTGYVYILTKVWIK